MAQLPKRRRRTSSPIQGDDMFAMRSAKRQNAPYFRRAADDGDDFWDNLELRHEQHRQHLRLLLIASAAVGALGLLIHTGFFMFALAILIPVPVELVMIRRTRPTVKIPDYRTPPHVDIELDEA